MVNSKTRSVIFILLRKLVVPVALVVAWIGIGVFAGFMIKENNENKVLLKKELVYNEIPDNRSDDSAITRNSVTSRSGSRVDRDKINTIYYEDVGVTVADSEIEILERIVQAEAGGSGYDGMLAVCNVVLNRVKSERFPSSVTDVVFAHRQFTPISDGRYYTIKVSDTARKVVSDALNGARIIGEDALYFCTPTASGKGWFETALRKIDYIEPHNFYGYKIEEE